MKKIVKILSFAVAFLVCAQTVHADMIFEPSNSFYARHSGKCEIVEREFVANGPNGEVIVYKSPEDATKIGTMKNGETSWVTWTYKDADGIVWGCPNRFEDGWVPMDYMQVVYDYISFEEECGDKVVEEKGSLDASYLGKTVYFWEYPRSTQSKEIPYELDPEWVTWMPEYHKTYVDEAGRKWGFCNYYYGTRNFWVCLDAADADYEALYGEMPEETVEAEHNMPPIEDAAPIVPKERFPIESVVGIVTGVILIKMKKR